MQKIYVNQTKLRLNFNLNADITGATVKIKVKAPDNTNFELNTLTDNALKGKVVFISDATPMFTQKGIYKMYANAVFPSNLEINGSPCELRVVEIGT